MTGQAETAFVRQSVREPDARRPGGLATSARAVQDWDGLAHLAVRHRVAEYVLRASAGCGIALPAGAHDLLVEESLSCQAVAMLLDGELERLSVAMAAARVPLLVLKGPALSRTLYPDPQLRPYADLDLTVQASHEAAAIAALLACGYSEISPDDQAHGGHGGHDHEHDGSAAFHRLFAGANGRALVELHLDPLQLGIRPTCEAERWARARPLPNAHGALMLAAEDQVVHLSVHAQKHGFSRLIWLKDLDLLLRQQHIDWNIVRDVAHREGVAASVWYALELTRTLLSTPLPAAALRWQPSLATRLLYAAVWPARRVTGLQGFLRRRAVQFVPADSWRGMLPSLLLMGRRSARMRAIVIRKSHH